MKLDHPRGLITRGGDRSVAIDALRLVGIIAVIVGHVWSTEWVRLAIYTWHVPLFFFLTGYLWKPGGSVRSELAKRSRTLLLPYIIWLLIIGIGFFVASRISSGSWELAALTPILLGGSFIGRPFSAFWFVTALFFASVLARLADRWPVWVRAFVAIGALTVAAIYPSELKSIPLAAGISLPCLAFIFAGQAFHYGVRRTRIPIFAGFVALAVVAVGIALRIVAPIDAKASDFGTFLLSPVAACVVCASLTLIFQWSFSAVGSAAQYWVTEFAQGGLVVILTHAAILWALKAPPLGSAMDLIAAVVLPFAFAYIVRRTTASVMLSSTPRAAEWLPRNTDGGLNGSKLNSL